MTYHIFHYPEAAVGKGTRLKTTQLGNTTAIDARALTALSNAQKSGADSRIAVLMHQILCAL